MQYGIFQVLPYLGVTVVCERKYVCTRISGNTSIKEWCAYGFSVSDCLRSY
ncbi:hypothetical protein QW060_25635 [Myroides ceti]|uniref:Uncharacterized protein n=1 Tax=Paenimyroides ceti TaxID=395087 RepID=A0ABT8D4G0_9FLAO|nr:hypothetical protein [Paenimyroides ceti]MDN3710242.1 hypothetical protein [Paenimyroides ceti]